MTLYGIREAYIRGQLRPGYLSPGAAELTAPELDPVWERLAEATRCIAEAHAMSTSMTLRPRKRRWGCLCYLDGQALRHLHRHLISLLRPVTRT